MRDTASFRAPLWSRCNPRGTTRGYERRFERFLERYAALVNDHCTLREGEILVRADGLPALAAGPRVRLDAETSRFALPSRELLGSALIISGILRARAHFAGARVVEAGFVSVADTRSWIPSWVMPARPENVALAWALQRSYGEFEDISQLQEVFALHPNLARCAYYPLDRSGLSVARTGISPGTRSALQERIGDIRACAARWSGLDARAREAAIGLAPSWEASLDELLEASCLV